MNGFNEFAGDISVYDTHSSLMSSFSTSKYKLNSSPQNPLQNVISIEIIDFLNPFGKPGDKQLPPFGGYV